MLSAALEDRYSIGAGIDEAARLLLREPKSLRREDRRTRTVPRPYVDQPNASGVAFNRLSDASKERRQGVIPERLEEVADREIVWHHELVHVGDNYLHVLAAMLMCPRGQRGASDLRERWRDLDTDNAAEWSTGGLMHHSAFSTPKVDKCVAIGNPDVPKGSGEDVPGSRHVVDPIVTRVLRQSRPARSVDATVQHTVSEPVQHTIRSACPDRDSMNQEPSFQCQPGPQASSQRRRIQLTFLFLRPTLKLFPSRRGVAG
jgi:hypothetical protein